MWSSGLCQSQLQSFFSFSFQTVVDSYDLQERQDRGQFAERVRATESSSLSPGRMRKLCGFCSYCTLLREGLQPWCPKSPYKLWWVLGVTRTSGILFLDLSHGLSRVMLSQGASHGLRNQYDKGFGPHRVGSSLSSFSKETLAAGIQRFELLPNKTWAP